MAATVPPRCRAAAIAPRVGQAVAQRPNRHRRPSGAILAGVGMNPFRPHRRSPADYVMVAAAILVCIALVAWALFG